MYYVGSNNNSITDGHSSIQIGQGLAMPTKKEMELAGKVIKALNNTYSSGIDPEKVPGMKEAIRKTIFRFDSYWDEMRENVKLHTSNFKSAFLKTLKDSL